MEYSLFQAYLLQCCLFWLPDLWNVEFDFDNCYCDFGYIFDNNSELLVLL